MTKKPYRPKMKTCTVCKAQFLDEVGRQKRCTLCKEADPHRNRARATALPEMAISFDNEGIQEGEGDDANMRGFSLSWGTENGESGTWFWKYGDDAPYEEREAVGALLYMTRLLSQPFHLSKPWGKYPVGTKVRLRPVSFHFGYDAAIFLKGFDLGQMQIVRKVQRKIESLLCRATHAEGEKCDKVYDAEARQRALAEEIERRKRTGDLGEDEEEPEVKGVLHSFNTDDIWAVLTEGGESDLAVWDKRSGLALTFTPRRRFYIEYRPNGDWYGGWKGRVDIHDTGSAFVGGLEKAIADWNPPLSDEQRAAIKWGKQARKNGFSSGTPEQIAAYSEAECVAHAAMCRQLVNTVHNAAHVPMSMKNLYGSGSIAKAALKHWGVPKRGLHENSRQKSILEHEEIARLTYFGGVVSTPMIGRVPLVDAQGREIIVVGQDINSAYPDKFVDVPCMRRVIRDDEEWDCGYWTRGEEDPGRQHVIGHVLASWDISVPDPDGNIVDPETGERYSSLTSIPPFSVRGMNMGVYTPVMGHRTWVSLAEFRAAADRFGNAVQAHEYLVYIEDCQCNRPRPLAHVKELYNERLELKSQADTIADTGDLNDEFWSLFAKQLTIKLIINSIYGKFAQMRPSPGAYTNLHIASYITGATRAQMRKKVWDIEDRGGQIAYVHTDAAYAIAVLEEGETPEDAIARLGMEDEGSELGKWGAEAPNRDMLLWQPGLAHARDKYKKGQWRSGGKVAARGIGTGIWEAASEGLLSEADLGDINFEIHPRFWPAIHATDRTMISLRKARAMGKPHLAGSFQNTEKTLAVFTTIQKEHGIEVPLGQRRDYDSAKQVAGIPTLWEAPPPTFVQPATVADMKEHKTALDKRYALGMYDQETLGK